MDFNAFKQAVAAAAAAAGVADYELYYSAAESTSVGAFQHEINKFTSAVEGGVCLRCLVNGRMGYASTESLAAENAAELVRRAADNAAVLECEEPAFLVEGGQSYTALAADDQPMPAAAALIETVLAGQDALYAAGAIDGSSSMAFAERCTIAICNSRGLDVCREGTVTGCMSAAVVTDGSEKANEYKRQVKPFAELDVAANAAAAVAAAKAKLGADVAPTGAWPVVFSPKAMTQLLATFAGVFNAENALKGLSPLKGKEGEVIAASCVTLTDDPFYPESPMPMPFDAEGSPTVRKNIIENGVLHTLLYNLSTAAAAGKATTGNAAKASFASKVGISPFTLVLAPGAVSEEELLAGIEKGVYIDSLGGLHAGANPVSGDFSLQSAGFMIENGKPGAPVRSFTAAGNFLGLLRGIKAVASNVEMPSAGGITGYASPSVLVEGLTIAGK